MERYKAVDIIKSEDDVLKFKQLFWNAVVPGHDNYPPPQRSLPKHIYELSKWCDTQVIDGFFPDECGFHVFTTLEDALSFNKSLGFSDVILRCEVAFFNSANICEGMKSETWLKIRPLEIVWSKNDNRK